MPKVPIDRSPEPMRLFQLTFFERFTHITPAIVLISWVPVTAGFFTVALLRSPAGAALYYIPVAWLLGLFIWSFVEYVVHRFAFHFPPRTSWQEKALYGSSTPTGSRRPFLVSSPDTWSTTWFIMPRTICLCEENT